MGMSTHCVGFRPADDRWNRMKAIWTACEELGVEVPIEVDAFFDGEDPEDKPGQEVSLGNAVSEYGGEMVDGYEIDVTKLPSGVKIIRVFNSY